MLQLKWVWKNMQGKRIYFIIAMLLSVIGSIAAIFVPKITQLIIDNVFKGDMSKSLFISLAITIVLVTLFRTILRYLMQNFLEISSQQTLLNVQRKMFANLVSQDTEFFGRYRTGDIISRATGDLDYIRHAIAGLSHMFTESVVLLIGTIIMLSTMHIWLTVSMLVITPLILFMTERYSKKIRPFYVELRNKGADISTIAQENLAGNRVVKAFAREEYEIDRFKNCCEDYVDCTIQVAIKHQQFAQVISFITDLLGVILIILGGYFVVNSKGATGVWQLTLGELAAFSSMRSMLANPLKQMGSVINDLQRFFASADKVIDIFYSKPIITDRNDCYDTNKRIEGNIKFDHVTFSYGDSVVLKDISFEIKPQETIAIMGPTGSGKTALINLICRLYDPDSGHVYIDGIDVHKWKLAKLHSSIGVAMQDVFLFSESIKENISYGNPDMPKDDVKQFAHVADAEEFIEHFDEKYETVVGERGVGLSGGQRQRIALARALAVKPPILILDDTTSAVDMETEKRIQEELANLNFPCTKIIVAQRISSVRRADRIFILTGGKVDIGTHETLSSKPGYYRDVCRLQNVADLIEIPGEKPLEVSADV